MIDLDMFERNQIDELRRETALMALSKHENILPVYSSFVSGSKLYIVTPYLAGGSCLDIMKTAFPDGLDELSIATILKQALEGICYLHKNGHIHRDVKSGNLLVDEDGSVLLGDFGVSSSLMDGERGLRKTFVGTPCWMAPEVMEQAGYDYKADIWSFGITAIELATGQAPFAKLPPLKVLLMTLSNDPPTLMRETTKHKYSKIFKDMIDLCLCKDPFNRPTAEKLLLHPFFKQARKKDYLVKNILLGLPPLERRPRKGVHRRQHSFTTSDEWDFNDNDNNGDNDDDYDDGDDNLKSINYTGALYDHSNKNINNNTTNISSKCLTGNDNKMCIIDTSPPACHHDYVPPRDPVALPKPKRHISFGHVIVRNPPQPSTTLSSSQPVFSTTSGQSLTQDLTPSTYLSVDSDTTTDGSTKKTTNIDSSNSSSTSMKYPIYGEDTDYQDGKVKTFGAPKSSSRVSNNDETYPIYHLTKTESSDSTGERRSRFEVHHGQDPIMVPLSATNNALFPPTSVSSHFHAHDSLSSTSSSSTSANEISTKETSVKTSTPKTSSSQHARDSKDMTGSSSSNSSSSGGAGAGTGGSCEPRKVGRFELTTKSAATTTIDSIHDSSSSGRNSLEHHPSAMSLPSPTNSLPLHNSSSSIHHSVAMASSGSHQHHASDTSNSSYSTTPPHSSAAIATSSKSTTSTTTTALLQSHLKELIRNNDAQRHLIEDIFGTMQSQRSHQHLYSSPTNEDDMTSMIESLEKQLCRIGNENSALRMENGQLRKELDLVRFV
ncbi:unnamed protein product [Absidia cylindrospora]